MQLSRQVNVYSALDSSRPKLLNTGHFEEAETIEKNIIDNVYQNHAQTNYTLETQGGKNMNHSQRNLRTE